LDRKKVKRTVEKPLPIPAKPWRRTLPYFFMGVVFLLGFLALMMAGRVILAAMVFAGMEYHVYRMSAGPSSIEHEFSALSDMFCFAVVPGFLIYRLAFHGWGILGLIGLFVVIFAGLIRLSLYKLYHPVSGNKNLVGIPLSLNAAFISLVCQLAEPQHLYPLHRLALFGAVTILSFLTISTIPYPNPVNTTGTLILAALVVAGVFLGPPAGLFAVWVLLAGGGLYIFLAPFLTRKETSRT
jgi:phosphatidylserine synthase